MILVHVHGDGVSLAPSRPLGRDWTVVSCALGRLDGIDAQAARHLLFDVDLTDRATALEVRASLSGPHRASTRIFACRRGDRHAAIQAGALGATQIIDRPIADSELLGLLSAPDADEARVLASPITGAIALDLAFGAMKAGERVSSQRFESVASDIAGDVGRIGIEGWLEPIMAHHVGTYRHCLLVTGLSSAFGQALGLSEADVSILTLSGLLHDVGKARTPRHILDKPSALTAEEFAVMKEHPVAGEAYLAAFSDVSADVRDVVRHHHEYRDGSGYPDGLKDAAICDLTRLVTIADVYAALVEERTYKPALPATEAMRVLREMAGAGKLESALVEAFGPVAGGLSGAGSPEGPRRDASTRRPRR